MPPFTQGRRTSAWCSSVRARATSTSTKQQRLPRVCRIMSDAWASSLTPMRSCWNTPSPAAISTRCNRSEEHTSELQSLMRTSYAVFCLKKKTPRTITDLGTTTEAATTVKRIDHNSTEERVHYERAHTNTNTTQSI